MSIGHNSDPDATAPSGWTKRLQRYQKPSVPRSLGELALTGLPFLALWVVGWAAYYFGYWWLSLLIALPAGAFLVRLFMIQHDCGHGSFFSQRVLNDWVGRVISVLTLTPYDFWRRTHAIHHATAGNLDKRGIGDVTTLTVREYQSFGFWQKLRYRIYRNPVVLFGVGPAYLFLIQQRLPIGLMRKAGWSPWISTQATNVAIAAAAGGLIWLVGYKAFLLVHLPVVLIAATIGVWLFYVQHQFEDTFWTNQKGWDFHEAALRGSSFYDLPAVLRWFTANIGIHHIHHMSSRIPFYRLNMVLRENPPLRSMSRITLLDSFRCVRLALWDEQGQRLVSFREARNLKSVSVAQG